MPVGLQVMEVEPTQELEDCKRLLIFAIDALITRLRAVGVRKRPFDLCRPRLSS